MTHDARIVALRMLVREAFEVREAAALALGGEWHARTPAEREEFSRLDADVIESAYLGGLGSRARVREDGIRVASPARTSFWIQVGAFRDTDAASRLVERLRDHSVMVATGGRRSDPLARVLVGPFTTRAAAASILNDLAAGGYRAFIAVE